jgi:hypothetical protein
MEPQARGQPKNSFRQSQTIVWDLKHHYFNDLPSRPYSFWMKPMDKDTSQNLRDCVSSMPTNLPTKDLIII